MSCEPERGVPRIFVGNLVPSITDAALRRTLSRYGTVRSVERHPRFAHVSIVPSGTDEGSIERAVAVLNGTKWAGTELRVEKACEHYLTRLRREWAEDIKGKDGEGGEISAARTTGKLQNVTVSAVGKWRGRRATFSDGDDGSDCSVCDDAEIMDRFGDDDLVLLGRTKGLQHGVAGDESSVEDPSSGPEDVSGVPTRPPGLTCTESEQRDVASDGRQAFGVTVDIDQKSQVVPSSTHIEANEIANVPAPDSRRAQLPVSAPVGSTMALFGLADDDPTVEDDAVRTSLEKARNMKRKREGENIGSGKRNRPRSGFDETYDADAVAAEKDPSRVDAERERSVARALLLEMFPGSLIPCQRGGVADETALLHIVRQLRKPGLFRGLLERGDVSGGRILGKKSGRRIPVKGAVKKFAKFAEKSSISSKHDHPRCTDSGSHTGGNALPFPARRAGLFRRLVAAASEVEKER